MKRFFRILALIAPIIGLFSPGEPALAVTVTVLVDEVRVETGATVEGVTTPDLGDSVTIDGIVRALAPGEVAPEDVTDAMTSAGGVVTNGGADQVTTTGEVEARADARDGQTNSAEANATAAGVDAGAGVDSVTNTGILNAHAGAHAEARGGLWTLLQRSVAEAVSNALGIGGGKAGDTLSDEGTTTVEATATAESEDIDLRLFGLGRFSPADAPTHASAEASAMTGGAGHDTLTTGESAELDVDATADASVRGGSIALSGVNANSVKPHAEATASGLSGGSGDDTLHHRGRLDVHAEASVDELDVEVTGVGTTGSSDDDIASGADARATGIDGGNEVYTFTIGGGREGDILTNDGELLVSSKASSTHTGVAITGPGYARTSSAPGASAQSVGMDGGDGDETLSNPTGRIHARSEAENTTNDVAISVLGIAGTFNGQNTADAVATGIAGGDGIDTIQTQQGAPPPPPANPDAPAIHAEAIAIAVSRDLSIGVLQSADVAAAPLATATAKGIDAGVGDDTVVNDREMRIEASADSSAIGAEIRVLNSSPVTSGAGKGARRLKWFTKGSDLFLTAEGLVVDNEATSEAGTMGIAGGAGSDTLTNQASVDARSSAESSRVGVGISVGTNAVVSAGTRAVADATGMDGHGGEDPIELNVLERIIGRLPFVTSPVQPPPDLGDTIENHSTIEASSYAHAASTAVGVGISISGSGGSGGGSGGGGSGGSASAAAADAGSGGGGSTPSSEALNSKVRVKASSVAEATAAGIRGGAGADVIDNHGSIDLAGGEDEAPRGGAHAEADANSVAVEIGGCKTCFAAGDALVSARSSAAGIDGEEGNDTLTNHDRIDALATADARALQVSFTTAGAAINDASLKFDWTDTKKGEATAAGIAGGAGADAITNQDAASITATAEAESRLHEVTADVKGVSLSISSSLATAEATGIDGAGGATLPEDKDSLVQFLARTRDRLVGLLPFEIPGLEEPEPPPDLADTIENRGEVTAVATAESKVIDVAGTYKGVAASTDSLWDNGVASVARAEGIDGGDGEDSLTNFSTGRIDAQASAFTRDVSGSVVYQGLAATSSSARSSAEGWGMRGGAGDDTIVNHGVVVVGDHGDEGIQAITRGFQGSVAIKGVAGVVEPIDDTGVHASAAAHGLSGDEGNDTVTNFGDTSAKSTSRSFGLSGTLEYQGVGVTNASVQSDALASGLAGDAGDDILSNDITAADQKVRAEANAHATGVKISAVYQGAALTVDPFWHAGTRSDAEAIGIDGGSGADTVTHGLLVEDPGDGASLVTRDSLVEAEANAVSWGVDVSGAIKGVAGVLASNEAVATATGIQGGADPARPQSNAREFIDMLTETIGDAYREFVLGEEPVVEEADGIDILTNYGTIDAKADARSRGIEVGLNYQGVAAVVDPFADTGTIADATARAMAGGEGDDQLHNHGTARAQADSGALGISGTFSYAGVAATVASSKATSRATGLSGGNGDDTISNDTRDTDEVLRAEANATATGLRGAVAIYGVAGAVDPFWDVGTRAEATALGIDGGAGADTLTHQGTLEAVSDARATGVSVAGGIYGVAVTAADWEAHAHASGLRGGADSEPGDDEVVDGADTITNLGSVRTEATSVARGFQGTFEFGGVQGTVEPFASMGTDAESHAQGIAGGDGNDTLSNFGAVDTDAKSTSWGVAANINIYGVAATLASRSSLADARGLDGGDGNDILTHSAGLFDIDADAQATSVDGAFSFGGVAISADPFWTDGTRSTAKATGLRGGAGADDLLFGDREDPDADVPSGLFGATPDADVHAEASTFGLDAAVAVFGVAGASMDTLAEASAWGAHGGGGLDTIENRRQLKVDAEATSHTFEVAGVAIGAAVAASPSLDVGSDAVASAIGLAGGGAPADSENPLARDVVYNRGALDVDAKATMRSNSTAVGLAGGGITSSSTEAFATAYGLDGDGGPSLLLNEGGLDVMADATALGVDVGLSIIGSSASSSSSSVTDEFLSGTWSTARAAGIHGGSGNDELVNRLAETTDPASPFQVEAKARTTSVAVAVNGLGISLVGTDVVADADALGLDGGEGDDVIWNERDIRVDAEAEVRGAEVAFSVGGAGVNLGYGRSAEASATGLAGGELSGDEGNDFLSNSGTVTLISRADAHATRVQAVGAGFSLVDAYTEAYAGGIGMNGAKGNDTLINRGTLDVDADATTSTADVAATLIGVLHLTAESGARARAEGMQGWFGQDTLENYGTIIANAHSEPSAKNVAAAILGEEKSDTVGVASATSAGMDSGDDGDVVVNHAGALIDSDASASARASDVKVSVFGLTLGGAGAEADSYAMGMRSGEGANRIENAGEVQVLADSDAEATSVAVVVLGGTESGTGVQELEAGVLANAFAWGIQGDVGRDEVLNESVIDVEANAWSRVNGVQVDVIGTADLFSGAEAAATAYGIRTWQFIPEPEEGEPEPDPDAGDLVRNTGTIDVLAYSRARSNGRAINIIGAGHANSGQHAQADAWGIHSGDGDDVVLNEGTVTVVADSRSRADDNAFGGIGSIGADGAVTSESNATGFDLGTGSDHLDTHVARVTSLVDLPVDTDSMVAIGASRSGGLATGVATAKGVASSDGDNLVINRTTLSAYARTSGLVETDSGAISSGVSSNANGYAWSFGADLWGGDDRLENHGLLSSRAQVTNASDTGDFKALADAVGLDASAEADVRVSVGATGARMGDGADEFWNASDATTSVVAKVRAEAESDALAASTDANSYASGRASATGIDLGAGDDVALIEGVFSVLSDPNVDTFAEAGGVPGDAEADSRAYGWAWGLRLGDGDDAALISGTATVKNDVDAYAKADGDGIGDADGDGDARAWGSAVGIELGTGDDHVEITGSLEVESNVDAHGIGDGDDAGEGDAYASGFTRVTAIEVKDIPGDSQDIVDAGDKTIINRGTIIAKNVLDLDADGSGGWRGDESAREVGDERAWGIRTADGDDVVENHGTLEAFSQGGSAGIAIETGAGDDRVFLGAASRTRGHVRPGSGDDEVEVEDGFTLLDGDVRAGTGLDTLAFRGAGTFSRGDFHEFDALRKTGAGEYLVTTLPGSSMSELSVEEGRLRIEPGVSGQVREIRIEDGELELMQSFDFRDDGRLAVGVSPDGSSGLMTVNGLAGLDGVLEIFETGETFVRDLQLEILRATAFSGEFDDVILPPDFPLLDFSFGAPQASLAAGSVRAADPLSNLVFSADVLSFGSVAENSLQDEIGRYLDPLLPLASGDVLAMLTEFQQIMDVQQFAAAFSSLSPDSYDGTTRAGLDSARECARSFQRRAERVREGPKTRGKGTGSNGPWAEGGGSWSQQDGEDGFAGYDAVSQRALAGYDREIRDGLVGGVGLCYGTSALDFQDDRASADFDGIGGFVYGSWFGRNASLDASLGYVRQWYDQTRGVSVGTLTGAATSEHAGNLFSASASTGWRFGLGGSNLQPFASLYFLYLDEEGFTESGAAGANLRVGSRQTNSLVSDLGLRFWYPIELGVGQLLPRASAAWSYDFDIDDRTISASLVGAPGTPLRVDGQDVAQSGARIEAGVGFRRGPFSVWVDYLGGFRGDAYDNGVSGGIQWSF